MPDHTATDTTTTNRFVGKVLPNILDYYDTPTYNLRLYMIPPTKTVTVGGDPSLGAGASDDRADTPAGSGNEAAGWKDGAMTSTPDRTVILAQTGVTAGVEIDELEILTVIGGNGSEQTHINFRITQPQAVTFLDQIVAARKFIGAPMTAQEIPMILEINFQGYDESDAGAENPNPEFNADAGGKIRAIAGPYKYKLIISDISFNINESGSVYYFRCVAQDDVAYNNLYYKLPSAFSSVGATITEHLTDLETKLNDWFSANVVPGEGDQSTSKKDQIKFDYSGLVASADADQSGVSDAVLQNEIIYDPNVGSEIVQATTEQADPSKTAEDAVEEGDSGVNDKEGNDEEKAPVYEINWKEGQDFTQILGTLLSHNDEFMQKACRGKYKDQIVPEEADPSKDKVLWYKLKGTMEYGDYDKENNRYAKIVTWKPLLYYTARSSVRMTNDENPTTADETQNRLNAMAIKKAYHYIYTGRNDQILNLDISYKNGLALLVPPQGGTVGDVYQNNIINFTTVPLDEDSLFSALGLDQLFDIFTKGKALFNSFKNLGENALRELGNAAGLAENQIKDFISDRTGEIAQGLANALANNQTAAAIAGALVQNPDKPTTQVGVSTQSDRQRQIDSYYDAGEYNAQPSGYVYSADLTNPLTATGDDALEQAQNNVQESINNASAGEEGDNESGVLESTQASYQAGPADQGAYTGVKSTLFNYLYQQHKAPDFLMKLDMTVRGDPFYLGNPASDEPNDPSEPVSAVDSETDANYDWDKDQFLLFEMASPRYYDPHTDDEDKNTGEWGKAGFSYTISGAYRIIKVVNNFNKGMYTCDIQSVKETAIDLSKLTGNQYLSGQFELDDDRNQEAIDAYNSARDAALAGTGQVPNRQLYPVQYVKGLVAGSGSDAQTLLNQGLITQAEFDAYTASEGSGN